MIDTGPKVVWMSDGVRVVRHQAMSDPLHAQIVVEVATGNNAMGEPIWQDPRHLGCAGVSLQDKAVEALAKSMTDLRCADDLAQFLVLRYTAERRRGEANGETFIETAIRLLTPWDGSEAAWARMRAARGSPIGPDPMMVNDLQNLFPRFNVDTFDHVLGHVSKAAGKLHGLAGDADHIEENTELLRGAAFAQAEQANGKAASAYIADLIICAAKLAALCPGGAFDLEAAVSDRMAEKRDYLKQHQR